MDDRDVLLTERDRRRAALAHRVDQLRTSAGSEDLVNADRAVARARSIGELLHQIRAEAAQANPLMVTGTHLRVGLLEITTTTWTPPTHLTGPTATPARLGAPALDALGLMVAPAVAGEVQRIAEIVPVVDPPEKSVIEAGAAGGQRTPVDWHLAAWVADMSMHVMTRSSARFRDELGFVVETAVLTALEGAVLADVAAEGTAGATLTPTDGYSLISGIVVELDAVAATGHRPDVILASSGNALRLAAALGGTEELTGVRILPGAGLGNKVLIASSGAFSLYRTETVNLEHIRADVLGKDVGLFSEAAGVVRAPAAVRVATITTV